MPRQRQPSRRPHERRRLIVQPSNPAPLLLQPSERARGANRGEPTHPRGTAVSRPRNQSNPQRTVAGHAPPPAAPCGGWKRNRRGRYARFGASSCGGPGYPAQETAKERGLGAPPSWARPRFRSPQHVRNTCDSGPPPPTSSTAGVSLPCLECRRYVFHDLNPCGTLSGLFAVHACSVSAISGCPEAAATLSSTRRSIELAINHRQRGVISTSCGPPIATSPASFPPPPPLPPSSDPGVPSSSCKRGGLRVRPTPPWPSM